MLISWGRGGAICWQGGWSLEAPGSSVRALCIKKKRKRPSCWLTNHDTATFRNKMYKHTSSDLANETVRTTNRFGDDKLLLACYRGGVYCLGLHLEPTIRRSRLDTETRLFGEIKDKNKVIFFPRFAAMDKDEGVAAALTADVSELFVRVREIAFEGVGWSKDIVYDNPMPESMRANLDEKTKRCTDFFDRYNQAKRDMEKLAEMGDDMLCFTQLAARYGFRVPS